MSDKTKLYLLLALLAASAALFVYAHTLASSVPVN
jgi:hypothetical protein